MPFGGVRRTFDHVATAGGARVLVTGATGFVGSSLAPALIGRGDVYVRALVRSTSDVRRLEGLGVERVEADLQDSGGLRRAVEGSDVVFHLAALTRARSEAAFREANVEGTRRLVDAIRADGRARCLVYLSSMAAVGPARNGRPVAPEDEPRPITAYGRSKLDGERVVLQVADAMRVVVLRAPAVYGPGDRDLLTFFRLARHGVLPVPMGRARRVQLIHVGDLAEALVRAAFTNAARGVYHVADPRAYTWDEMLGLVAQAVGRPGRRLPIPAWLVRAAGHVNGALADLMGQAVIFDGDKARELLASWLCDIAAVRRDLDFVPRRSLEEGLEETVAWYRAYGWLGGNGKAENR